MFVFGEVQDPNPETVNLVEDIVRSQVIELVCASFFNNFCRKPTISTRLFKREL